MLKIAVSGSTGKMGRVVVAEIARAADLDLQQDLAKTNVLIDFSLPVGTLSYLSQCVEHKIPMVIATTGFTPEQKEQIKQAAQKIPILMSPNMSIGVNLIFTILEKVVGLLDPSTLVTITDIHHKHKLDSPSGTALKIMDVISHAAPQLTNKITCNSTRVGEVMGEHNILFTLDNETIELSHKALSRDIFAKGAIKAARWLQNKPVGFYSMHDVIT
jgi:4-hydroxy-tetrahydrodipicolinate reductase